MTTASGKTTTCEVCDGSGQRATARSANGRELERHERSGTPCDAYRGTGRDLLAEEYDYGRGDGIYAAEYALQEGRGVTAQFHEDARESLSEAVSRRGRAYWLGYLRAYREVTRTLTGGRWGI